MSGGEGDRASAASAKTAVVTVVGGGGVRHLGLSLRSTQVREGPTCSFPPQSRNIIFLPWLVKHDFLAHSVFFFLNLFIDVLPEHHFFFSAKFSTSPENCQKTLNNESGRR